MTVTSRDLGSLPRIMVHPQLGAQAGNRVTRELARSEERAVSHPLSSGIPT